RNEENEKGQEELDHRCDLKFRFARFAAPASSCHCRRSSLGWLLGRIGCALRNVARQPVWRGREKLVIAEVDAGEGLVGHFAEKAVHDVLDVMDRVSRAIAQEIKRA